MKSLIIRTLSALVLSAAASLPLAARDFFDTGAADRFLELDVHLQAGTSAITQNYKSKFPLLTQFDMNPGASFGAGVGATFGLRDYLGLSTELNFMCNSSSGSGAIAGDGATPASSVFIKNRYYGVDVPVYVSVRFNLSENVRWNVEGGAYYSLGFCGSQKQQIYTSYINDVEQLINLSTKVNTDYYRGNEGFGSTSYRADWGLIVGTSVDVNRHVTVGVRAHLGLKNVAYVPENAIVRPNVHNMAFHGTIGWLF